MAVKRTVVCLPLLLVLSPLSVPGAFLLPRRLSSRWMIGRSTVVGASAPMPAVSTIVRPAAPRHHPEPPTEPAPDSGANFLYC